MMKLTAIVSVSALALAFAAPSTGFAQNLASSGIYVAPDHSMSVKTMLGVPIYNDKHEKIGTIETVMVKSAGGEPTVILSVGDYLGTGPKMIAVPLNHLKLEGTDAMTMAGATKAMLQSMPIYSIAGG
jgi:hypothetical protein